MLHNAELQKKHELKMQALRDELELRRKTEIHEIEEVGTEQCNYCLDRVVTIKPLASNIQ